jgi:hypothetical protein
MLHVRDICTFERRRHQDVCPEPGDKLGVNSLTPKQQQVDCGLHSKGHLFMLVRIELDRLNDRAEKNYRCYRQTERYPLHPLLLPGGLPGFIWSWTPSVKSDFSRRNVVNSQQRNQSAGENQE